MPQVGLKEFTLDLGSMEKEVQRRLRHEKKLLLIFNIFCFILAAACMFLVI